MAIRTKFNNHVSTCLDPWTNKMITWKSNKEKERWRDLNLAQKAGKITHLERQTPFKFYFYDHRIFEDKLVRGKVVQRRVIPKLICTYYSDFTYYENGVFIVEDTKGQRKRIPPYPTKKRMMELFYDIEIRET